MGCEIKEWFVTSIWVLVLFILGYLFYVVFRRVMKSCLLFNFATFYLHVIGVSFVP